MVPEVSDGGLKIAEGNVGFGAVVIEGGFRGDELDCAVEFGEGEGEEGGTVKVLALGEEGEAFLVA